MQTNKTYYRKQLKRLEVIEEDTIYPLKFKITGQFNQTNWLALNKSTAIVLIEWLTKKYL